MATSDIFPGRSRWTTYEGERLLYTLVGGIPKDPDTIRAWLKARLEMGEVEIRAIADETIEAMGWTQDDLTSENLDKLVDTIMARDTKGNSFKMIDLKTGKPVQKDGDLVIEGRQIKAAIKEAANALYPGVEKWPGWPGNTRKGLASYSVERVEVVDRYIPLGRQRPDIVGEQRIKHISGPQGKRSTINVVDVCEDVTISFTVKVLDDFISEDLWGEIWEYVDFGGIGADRARGDGRGTMTKWERIPPIRPLRKK